MKSKQRVFLSGLGVICPAGDSLHKILNYLKSQNNTNKYCSLGKARSVQAEPGNSRYYVHQVVEIEENDSYRNFDRHSEYAAVAAEQALLDSGISLESHADDRKGVRLGTFISIATSMSQFDESVLAHGPRRCNIGAFPSTVMSAAASRVSILKQIRGANTTLCSGKNSGFDAIGYSFLEIQNGQKDVIVCGGSDALSDEILLGLAGEDMLFEENAPILPNHNIEKIVPSEGACVLVLSNEKMAARNCSELLAFQTGFTTARKQNIQARSNDLGRSIELALEAAGLLSSEIDLAFVSGYFNQYDLDSEMGGIQLALGSALKNIPVLAFKKHLGESFSAFGPILYIFANYFLTQEIDQILVKNSNINSLWNGSLPNVSNVMLVGVDSFGHYSVAILKGEKEYGK